MLLISWVCCFYGIFQLWTMLSELKSYTRDDSFQPWWLLIPFLNLYFILAVLPAQVRKAKQMAGSRNPEPNNLLLYWFVGVYALANDLNQVWDPQSAG